MPGKQREHHYSVTVTWTGNEGIGTQTYGGYSRSHTLEARGKPTLEGSADPAFRGNASAWNPEDMLVASLSACHKLWYLHLCATAGIVVTSYVDHAEGVMVEAGDGGAFTSVTLKPRIRITDPARKEDAMALHHKAHESCFIANSVNFPVTCEALIEGDV